MTDYNKAIYGPAALIIAQAIIQWLRANGVPVDDQLANFVITPAIVGAVIWAVPNGINLATYLARIAQKFLGRVEQDLDEQLKKDDPQ